MAVDVDGTLIDGQSYASLLREILDQRWRRARLLGLLLKRLPYQALRRLHLVDRLDNQDRWARAMAWLFAGASVTEVAALMTAAARRLAPRMRPDLVRELAEHRRCGRRICLASTAVEPLVAALAPLVDAEMAVGTHLAVAGGRYTGALEGEPCNGIRKVDRIDTLLARHGEHVDWPASYAYSDGLPDLPMLERAGQAVVVAPDRGLADVARVRSWRFL